VADYKDLLFHTAVDHNKLINGGYKILVQIEDEFKSNTSGFHFYIYTFKITENNNDVIS
jgi:hypothetical protein